MALFLLFAVINGFLVLLDGMSSQEYLVDSGVLQDFILGRTHFLLCINNPADDVICHIAIYADDTTLYSNMMRHLICGNN